MRFPIFLTFTFMAMFSFNSIAQSNSNTLPKSDESHGTASILSLGLDMEEECNRTHYSSTLSSNSQAVRLFV